MSGLSDKRYRGKKFAMSGVELPGKVETYFQGGRACVDTSTGLCAKAFASATLVPIGVFSESGATTVSGTPVHITLDREVICRWFENEATDLVLAADLLKNCFVQDDQTVCRTNGGGTKSVAGRVWRVDAVKGVLVETRP